MVGLSGPRDSKHAALSAGRRIQVCLVTQASWVAPGDLGLMSLHGSKSRSIIVGLCGHLFHSASVLRSRIVLLAVVLRARYVLT